MNLSPQLLSPGPHIQGHSIQHCAENHTIIIDGGLIKFSRTEYRLIMMLLRHLENNASFVPFADLIQCFNDPLSNPRRSLSRRINSIREKLWPYGLDIASVRDIGYMLILVSSLAKTTV